MTDWIYETARVRVQESRLLTESDWDTLLRLSGEGDCLRFLEQKEGRADSLSDYIRQSEHRLQDFLQAHQGETLAFREEPAYGVRLKIALRQALTENPTLPAEPVLTQSIRERQWGRLGFYAQAVEQAVEEFLRTQDVQTGEEKIDDAVVERLFQIGQKKNGLPAALAELVARQTVLRMLVGGAESVPRGHGLPANISGENPKALFQTLREVGLESAAQALEQGRYDRFCEEEQEQLCRQATDAPAVLLRYVVAKNRELRRLRQLAAGKRLGQSAERIRERMDGK